MSPHRDKRGENGQRGRKDLDSTCSAILEVLSPPVFMCALVETEMIQLCLTTGTNPR